MLNDTEKFVITLASPTLFINGLMGQIAHLRNNKLEQSYDFTSTFVQESLDAFWGENGLSFV